MYSPVFNKPFKEPIIYKGGTYLKPSTWYIDEKLAIKNPRALLFPI